MLLIESDALHVLSLRSALGGAGPMAQLKTLSCTIYSSRELLCLKDLSSLTTGNLKHLTSTKLYRGYRLNMEYLQLIKEVLQSYSSWEPRLHSWPLVTFTFTKSNKLLEFNVWHLHENCEIRQANPSWNIVFRSQGFLLLTFSGPMWSLRWSPTNQYESLMQRTFPFKLEILHDEPSWNIM